MDSFVVRMWRLAEDEPPASAPRARGVAIHVRSGTTCTFRSGEELLGFLSDPAARPADPQYDDGHSGP